MGTKKRKYKPVPTEWLSWTTQLAEVTNVPYDDIEDEDTEVDDSEEDPVDPYDELDPLIDDRPKDPRKTRTQKSDLRHSVQERLKELRPRQRTLREGLPALFSERAGVLDLEYQRLSDLAEKELGSWVTEDLKAFEGDVDSLELGFDALDDSKRRHANRLQQLRQRVAELNERAIEVRFQAPVVLNAGISLLGEQYRELDRKAQQEIGGLDLSGLSRFETELDRFEQQSDALEALFDVCPGADEFLSWASTQKEKSVTRVVKAMNEALEKKPPNVSLYFDSLTELEKLREKSERELERLRRLDALTYTLDTVHREVQAETEQGLFKRNDLERARKELLQSALELKQRISRLRQRVRNIEDKTFIEGIEGLEKSFKALERDNDEHQTLVEERSDDKASKEYMREINERGARPTTIERARTTGEPTGWILSVAVSEVSGKIKKWEMYDDVIRVWRGTAENRSGPNTSVLHHHCHDNYKHNLLYDGAVILGIVNGHMEKAALKSIQKQEETVAARKGGEAKEVCLLANRVLVIV